MKKGATVAEFDPPLLLEEAYPEPFSSVAPKVKLAPSSAPGLVWLSPLPLVALAACGGGGGGDAGTGAVTPVAPAPVAVAPTLAESARFLEQASIGATGDEILALSQSSFDAWLTTQFAAPTSQSHWDWQVANGWADIANQFNRTGLDNSVWRKLLSSPDPLRQAVTLALSEIMVVSSDGVDTAWPHLAVGAYLDILEANAFGNFRTLLQQISTSPAMGVYLTFRNNQKANAAGALPDENYARELMQLFTIGLNELNADGTNRLPLAETYAQNDISQLARVFTGWNYNAFSSTDPGYLQRAMINTASQHETGASTFLTTTIPAGNDGAASLKLALDGIFAHANVGPFIAKQLIQRLVTSNPSAAYVGRVAAVFNNNGSGVRGDLQATVRTLLLDTEARSVGGATSAGKLKEPALRLAQWARSFSAKSTAGAWNIGNLNDPATKLGQQPMRAPSVFNFFRPGYVPPATALGAQGLVAPELQITTESSVAGYLNFMQRTISSSAASATAGVNGSDVVPDYSKLLALVADTQGLVNELNKLLASFRLSAATQSTIKTTLDGMPVATDANKLNRIYAAVLLVMATPEYLVQK